jgi:phenylpropionate dioxygenase-like ring-hydroxylating dioxygenase large terminal subunit
MELPEQITEIGEQLAAGGAITPSEDLFETYEVFAAELTNLFIKPWLAADHASRLSSDGDYFRVDIGGRSVVIAREATDKIHAMRNACLHAGYRICEEEEGHGDHLFCRYHGWDYAIDGRLTDPMLRPEEKDRSRFRLQRYAMRIVNGLIFIDPSAAAPSPPEAKPISAKARSSRASAFPPRGIGSICAISCGRRRTWCSMAAATTRWPNSARCRCCSPRTATQRWCG